MITVERKDFPARDIKNKRTGEVIKTIPARYTCRYYHQGREIAFYESDFDCLYLKTDLILRDFSKPIHYRALNGKCKEVFAYLFDMLNVDETSRLSEFCNL